MSDVLIIQCDGTSADDTEISADNPSNHGLNLVSLNPTTGVTRAPQISQNLTVNTVGMRDPLHYVGMNQALR